MSGICCKRVVLRVCMRVCLCVCACFCVGKWLVVDLRFDLFIVVL